MPVPDFKPGDLIDANKLVTYLIEFHNETNARLLALEQKDDVRQGQVFIAAVIPPDKVRVGETLRILGSNFYFSVGATHVSLGAREQTLIPRGSSDVELLIEVGPLTPVGKTNLMVWNSFTNATWPIEILPARTRLGGNVGVKFITAEPRMIRLQDNEIYIFRYELDTTGMTRESHYQITPRISVDEWDAAAEVLDENDEQTRDPFDLGLGKTQAFGVRFRLTPQNPPPQAVEIHINVDAVGDDRHWSLADHTFQDGEDVGEAIPIRIDQTIIAAPAVFDDDSNTITVHEEFELTMEVSFTAVGTYLRVSPLEEPDFDNHTGWTVISQNAAEIQVTEQMLQAGGGAHSDVLVLFFTPANPQNADFKVGYRLNDREIVESFHLILG